MLQFTFWYNAISCFRRNTGQSRMPTHWMWLPSKMWRKNSRNTIKDLKISSTCKRIDRKRIYKLMNAHRLKPAAIRIRQRVKNQYPLRKRATPKRVHDFIIRKKNIGFISKFIDLFYKSNRVFWFQMHIFSRISFFGIMRSIGNLHSLFLESIEHIVIIVSVILGK